ncbi:MAG: ABC transporter permease subunit [Alphaproteobacteria bacterium]|nr:ABC transporter permease subunit [Alphaproteobacteria bacterium]
MKNKTLFPFLFLLCALLSFAPSRVAAAGGKPVIVGSKKFTESVVLGEIVKGVTQAAGVPAIHKRQFGGTRIIWRALKEGDIDAYVDYTGTLYHEDFAGQHITTMEGLRKKLSTYGVSMAPPLGFQNNYAIAMDPRRAKKLGIRTISDLRRHPELKLGFPSEFLNRKDGWPGMRAAYALPQTPVNIDQDLAYRGLVHGSVDAVVAYTTDAEIDYYHLALLKDDLHYFPIYKGVILYRTDLEKRAPAAVRNYKRLAGRIDTAAMAAMNRAVKIDRRSESAVAAGFLKKTFGMEVAARRKSWWTAFWRYTFAHLLLVLVSLSAAIAVSVPAGILAARHGRLGQVILGAAGVLQTMPSLALFVFMIPLFGIGRAPAIAALFLYSLLPIVRNTYAGLTGIPDGVLESAEALGLPERAKLWRIKLPMAAPTILAGIKTAAVINVGTATLAALIGAGGYGEPILAGIRLDDIGLIMTGAVPAAGMALLMQYGFELVETACVSKGLRLQRTG